MKSSFKPTSGDSIYEVFPMLKTYRVFNLEDTTGIEYKIPGIVHNTEGEKIEICENIISNMPNKPKISHLKKTGAFYVPAKDYVNIPEISIFKREPEYYSTLFHELAHSTGSIKRLNRDMGGKFGSKKYAKEELIAELTASFLCGYSGILQFSINNTSAYLKSWLKALKEEMKADKKFILEAAAKAQKAYDYIMNFEDEVKPVKTPVKTTKKTADAEKQKRIRIAKAKAKGILISLELSNI
jgi:antirestriction protein ArdC